MALHDAGPKTNLVSITSMESGRGLSLGLQRNYITLFCQILKKETL